MRNAPGGGRRRERGKGLAGPPSLCEEERAPGGWRLQCVHCGSPVRPRDARGPLLPPLPLMMMFQHHRPDCQPPRGQQHHPGPARPPGAQAWLSCVASSGPPRQPRQRSSSCGQCQETALRLTGPQLPASVGHTPQMRPGSPPTLVRCSAPVHLREAGARARVAGAGSGSREAGQTAPPKHGLEPA